MYEFGTLKVYCWLFAVKVILAFVTLKFTVPLLPKALGLNTLLNQIYLPDGIDVELKLDVREALITQLVAAGAFTVTTTFWILVHPFAVNV